jgi:hypothetical protein
MMYLQGSYANCNGIIEFEDMHVIILCVVVFFLPWSLLFLENRIAAMDHWLSGRNPEVIHVHKAKSNLPEIVLEEWVYSVWYFKLLGSLTFDLILERLRGLFLPCTACGQTPKEKRYINVTEENRCYFCWYDVQYVVQLKSRDQHLSLDHAVREIGWG